LLNDFRPRGKFVVVATRTAGNHILIVHETSISLSTPRWSALCSAAVMNQGATTAYPHRCGRWHLQTGRRVWRRSPGTPWLRPPHFLWLFSSQLVMHADGHMLKTLYYMGCWLLQYEGWRDTFPLI
jgi:hypothetical protein